MQRPRINADIAIIGAGVVGCAIARHLKIKYPNKEIVVLEKKEEVGAETSRLNSGVIHSGIQENPKFLKSKLAKRGSELAVRYAMENNVPIIHCGMLAAMRGDSLLSGISSEWKSFFRLVSKAYKSGLNYRFLLGRGVRKLEPNLKIFAAVHIPDVWVTDPLEFTRRLGQEAYFSGVRFFFRNPVQSIDYFPNYWEIWTSQVRCIAKAVINSAGLYADEIAEMAGYDKYQIYPWRGEYYEILGAKAQLVRRLIYMATPPKNVGKGIHFGPRVDGRLFIGPNAKLVAGRDFYFEQKTPVETFLKAGRNFFPDLEEKDLRWGYSGIRPRLTEDSKESDFIINLDCTIPPFVNLIGIESPGFTASMAIAEYVEEMLRSRL